MRLAGFLVLAVLLLAACGGGNGGDVAPTSTADPGVPASSTAGSDEDPTSTGEPDENPVSTADPGDAPASTAVDPGAPLELRIGSMTAGEFQGELLGDRFGLDLEAFLDLCDEIDPLTNLDAIELVFGAIVDAGAPSEQAGDPDDEELAAGILRTTCNLTDLE